MQCNSKSLTVGFFFQPHFKTNDDEIPSIAFVDP